jgi:ABC-2 type transport system permease protein
MTAVTEPKTPPGPREPGGLGGAHPGPKGLLAVRLIRAELLKIWTTNTWWIFGIITLVTTALALLISVLQANDQLTFAEQARSQPPPDFGGNVAPGEGGLPPEDIKTMEDQYRASIDVGRVLVTNAANVYTSGQFFGLLFMVILGVLIVTNEFFHQTATTTFLTTPHRTAVILSKLAAAGLLAFAFWAAVTAIDLAVGSTFFGLRGYSLPLGEWPVLRSVLMNVLAFVVWAVLGVGLGVLIRSQLGASLTASAFYLLSFPVAFIVFGVIRQFIIKEDWVFEWIVAVPGVASTVMISPEPLQLGPTEHGPQWWVGALVLVGYGAVAAVIGTLITRKRDIS